MEEEKGLVPQGEDPADQPLTTSEVVNKNLQLVIGANIVDENAMVYKTRCTICNAPCRKEVEKMHEANATLDAIQKYLLTQNITLSMTNIRHHFKEHYQSRERMMILLDYCDNLAEMMRNRRDKLQQLELMCNMGQMELMRAVSMPTGGSFEKEKERMDLITKAHKMICENIKLMVEMDDAEAKVKAVYIAFTKTFKAKIDSSKSEEEKKMWRGIARDFQQSVSIPEGGA